LHWYKEANVYSFPSAVFLYDILKKVNRICGDKNFYETQIFPKGEEGRVPSTNINSTRSAFVREAGGEPRFAKNEGLR